ncbi:50S ribosomal protein L3 [Patescibacteria group bacterium]|nr:50S ribosomal protein L3 [Patescibacteria group bacterium]
MKFILGKKIGMTQVFNEQGKIVPVTLIEAGPCFVIQNRTKEKDNYEAVQIGFEEMKESKTKKPQKGHFKKTNLEKNFRYLREFSAKGGSASGGKDKGLKIGQQIDVSIFIPGEIVSVTGISKGKGFQGVVKRHGFSGFPASHGTKHGLRAPGSIGSAWPQRVFKGKKMAGRMGSDRIAVQGLEIVEVDTDNNLLAIKGAVPGKRGTLLEIVATKEVEAVKQEEKAKEEKELIEKTKPKKEEK